MGCLLGENIEPGSVVALEGNLGAGKTCLARGMAQGLGVPEEYVVVSPTFTLANEYPGRVPFYHLDVFRLEGADFHDSGLDEYLRSEGVTAVEWAEKIVEELPESRIEVELSLAGTNSRQAVIRARGTRYIELLKKIQSIWMVEE